MDFNPDILKRFFLGKYSKNDFLAIKSLFEKPERRVELEKLLQNHWFEINNEAIPEGNIDHILSQIHQQIKSESNPVGNHRFLHSFQRIAAILIVPLLLAFLAAFYFQSKSNTEIAYAEIQCPFGVRTKFVLPDGTTGFINSGSTLSFPAVFTDQRNVELKGEAFFDVTRDEKHPFIVHTPHLQTKVLGTQFSVTAYENDFKEDIILKEGKVEVCSSKGEKLETLLPNQKLELDTKTNKYRKSTVEPDQYVLWTEGKLIFRNDGLQDVVNRLGRWYNVKIEIADAELLNYAFRATFIDEPLEEVFKLMTLTAPLVFEEQKREITKDNTYKKRKVIVRLDKNRQDAF
jgi:ferric-dicitrate binding protein FerR (iron transport regulator)